MNTSTSDEMDKANDTSIISREEAPLMIVATSGFLISMATFVYIVVKRRFHSIHQVTCINLLVSDIAFAGIRVLGCFVYINYEIMRCMSTANLLAIMPLVIDRVMAIKRPVHYREGRHWRIIFPVILACWVIPLAFAFTFEVILQENEIRVKLELLFFMVLPSALSVTSFILVFQHIRRGPRKMTTMRLHQVILLVKSVFITVMFIMSWLVPTLQVLVLVFLGNTDSKLSLAYFYFFNTITDPFFYLVPNSLIRKGVTKIREVTSASVSEGSGAKTPSKDMALM